MRSFAPSRGGMGLIKTPSYRQQAGRRRLAVACAVAALALASGLVGSLVHPGREAAGRLHTGPFSYFPSQ